MKKILAAILLTCIAIARADELEKIFRQPPADAKPWVYWFWMGSTITADGITGDLQALHDAGFGGSVMCSMADICTPWPASIGNPPTPDIITFNDKWWQLVRHAATESHRLDLQFGIGNCAGYETCGGPWVTPEFSMQEVVWSETKISGPGKFSGDIPKPSPDIHAHMPFPVYIGNTGKLGLPEVPARKTFFRDIAVLAVPTKGDIATNQIFDLSDKLSTDGKIEWDAPAGDWVIYRFGHTTMGSLLQPCQWEAIGLQADMMSREAMAFNMDHVIGDIQKHAGDLVGKGLNFVWFDSYEAGTPTWTPKMREEFQTRRGYDLVEFLPTLAKRTVISANETKKFSADFTRTVKDLYRDVYFSVVREKLHAANLDFCNEPYTGPFETAEVITNLDNVVTEFWKQDGKFHPSAVPGVVAAARKHGINRISAEAFTAWPKDSQFDEAPAELKSIGDAAFCEGVNRFVLHRYVHQPYGDKYKPGFAMGQWGTHFDRTQTWWPQFKAMVQYWQKCCALLQWGKIATNDFSVASADAGLQLKSIHRSDGAAEVYFVANIARTNGAAKCAFGVAGKQPELWNPSTGEMRDLPEYQIADGKTVVPLQFADSASWFVVFRKPISSAEKFDSSKNFADLKSVGEISGVWSVQFDPKWGGPEQLVEFASLENWTNRAESDIKYYSGTAVYEKSFDLPDAKLVGGKLLLDLGAVRDVAEVELNGRNLGIVWTAPWRVDISSFVKAKNNTLRVKITNCWANRQIGDEQLPPDCEFAKGDRGFGGPLKNFPDWLVKDQPRTSGRLTFATWNYFTKNSPLESSGLLGPVRLLTEE
jgi:alpha-L-rhamnosidase